MQLDFKPPSDTASSNSAGTASSSAIQPALPPLPPRSAENNVGKQANSRNGTIALSKL